MESIDINFEKNSFSFKLSLKLVRLCCCFIPNSSLSFEVSSLNPHVCVGQHPGHMR